MGDDERLRSIHALTYICLIHTLILMRTTVRLPAELLEHAKRKAAAEGKTLTALIEDGLRLVISPARTIEPKRSHFRNAPVDCCQVLIPSGSHLSWKKPKISSGCNEQDAADDLG
jgi:hypothetical protein